LKNRLDLFWHISVIWCQINNLENFTTPDHYWRTAGQWHNQRGIGSRTMPHAVETEWRLTSCIQKTSSFHTTGIKTAIFPKAEARLKFFCVISLGHFFVNMATGFSLAVSLSFPWVTSLWIWPPVFHWPSLVEMPRLKQTKKYFLDAFPY
jgi:hypothetical protein